MRTLYEAETAFLSSYQELKDAAKAGTAHYRQRADASGGVVVCFLGNSAANDLVWREVKVDADGGYTLSFSCASYGERSFDVEIDGEAPVRVAVADTKGAILEKSVDVNLKKGVHRIRLSNAAGWAPDIDCMTIVPKK